MSSSTTAMRWYCESLVCEDLVAALRLLDPAGPVVDATAAGRRATSSEAARRRPSRPFRAPARQPRRRSPRRASGRARTQSRASRRTPPRPRPASSAIAADARTWSVPSSGISQNDGEERAGDRARRRDGEEPPGRPAELLDRARLQAHRDRRHAAEDDARQAEEKDRGDQRGSAAGRDPTRRRGPGSSRRRTGSRARAARRRRAGRRGGAASDTGRPRCRRASSRSRARRGRSRSARPRRRASCRRTARARGSTAISSPSRTPPAMKTATPIASELRRSRLI